MSDTDTTPLPAAVADLPPRAKCVYLVLAYEGPQTRPELADRLGYDDVSNLSAPIRQLREAGVVVALPAGDRRRYHLAP